MTSETAIIYNLNRGEGMYMKTGITIIFYLWIFAVILYPLLMASIVVLEKIKGPFEEKIENITDNKGAVGFNA